MTELKASYASILQGHGRPLFPILLVQFQDRSFRDTFKLCHHLVWGGSCVSFVPVAMQSQSEAMVFSCLYLPCDSAALSMSLFKCLLFWFCLQWCHDWQWLGWYFLGARVQSKLHTVSGMVIKRLCVKTKIATFACLWIMRFLSQIHSKEVEIDRVSNCLHSKHNFLFSFSPSLPLQTVFKEVKRGYQKPRSCLLSPLCPPATRPNRSFP